MNASVQWEQKAASLLRITFGGGWDWDVFYKTFTDQLEQCSADERHLCVLIDLRDVTDIPSDAVLHLKNGARMAEFVEGKIIIIATSIAALTMYRLFVSIYKAVASKFSLAANDAAAYEILGLAP